MLNFSKINIILIYLIFFLVSIFSVLNLQHEDNMILNKKVNLGLDLQGGMHVVLEVDMDTLALNLADKQSDELRSFVQECAKISSQNESSFFDVLEREAKENSFRLVRFYHKLGTESDNESVVEELRRRGDGAVGSALEIIRNRVDEFGVSEPVIQRSGENRIIVELAGVHKRYHAPLARTVLLGKAEQKKIDAIKATNEALDEGISAIKPGNTADDVAQKFWAVLDKHDIKKESRTGYSIGIGYPPDWGEHTINISKGDQTILHPNVTFHMIAVMQFGSWGVEASHSLRVTENGSEKFSDFSSDLFIKD